MGFFTCHRSKSPLKIPTLFDKFVSSPDEFCNKKKLPIIYREIFSERPRSKLFYYQTD